MHGEQAITHEPMSASVQAKTKYRKRVEIAVLDPARQFGWARTYDNYPREFVIQHEGMARHPA